MNKRLCWLALMANLATFLLLLNLGLVFSYTCNGTESESSSVCSGRGKCSSFNNCSCNPGYFGKDCSKPHPSQPTTGLDAILEPFGGYVFVNGPNNVYFESDCSLGVGASVSSIGKLVPNNFISGSGGFAHYGDSTSSELYSSALKVYSHLMDAPCNYNIVDSNISHLEVEGGNVYCFENGWFAAQNKENVRPSLVIRGEEKVILKFPNDEGRLIVDHLDIFLTRRASEDSLIFVAKSSEIRGGHFKGRLFSYHLFSVLDAHIEGTVFILSSSTSTTTNMGGVSFDPIRKEHHKHAGSEGITYCDGVISTSSNVCSGEGICTDFNTCSCRDGRHGSRCEQITSKRYSTETTACSKETTCSNHGECVSDTCDCYSNSVGGYWTGASCNSCKSGYYGERCATSLVGPATITDDFRGITFYLHSPSSYVALEISCSKVLHPSDLSGGLYGSSEYVKCFYLDKTTSLFLVKFGSTDYSVQSGVSNLRINAGAFDNSTSNAITYLSLVINPPNSIPNPIALIRMPSVDVFSSCDSIVVDGSQSYSVDGKALTFNWALVDSLSLNVISSAYGDSPNITLDSSLAQGSYKIRLQVRSSFLNKDSTFVYSATFVKSSKVLPTLRMAKDHYSIVTYTHQFPLMINKIVEHSSCRSVGDNIGVEWMLVSGPTIEYSVDAYNNLYIPKLATFGGNVYTFKVSAFYTSDKSSKTSSTVTITTQSPELSLTLMKYEAKSDYTTIQVEYNDPESTFNTLSSETWTWSCIDNNSARLLTLLSGMSNTKKTYFTISASLFDTVPRSIDISLQIVKSDMRTVTKGMTVYFNSVPPVVNFVSIEPKSSKIAPGKNLVAQVLISSFSEKTNITWVLNGKILSSNIAQSGSSQTIKVDASTLTEGSSNTLSILVDDYTIGESTQLSYNFQVGNSPKVCGCDISPTIGNAMETQFQFLCVNCKSSLNNIDFRFGYIDERARSKVSLFNRGNLFSTKLPGSSIGSKVSIFIDIIDTTSEATTTIYKEITINLPAVASNVTLVLEKDSAWSSLSNDYLSFGAFGKSFYQSSTTSKIGSVLLNSALNGIELLSTAKECTKGAHVSGGCICSDGYVGPNCDVPVTEFGNIQVDKKTILNNMLQVLNGSSISIDGDYITMVSISIDSLMNNYPYLSNETVSSALITLDRFLDGALLVPDLGLTYEGYMLLVKSLENVYYYISGRNSGGYSNGIKLFRILKKFSLLRARSTNVNFPEYVKGSFYHSTVGKSTLYNYPTTNLQIESSTSVSSSSLFPAQQTVIAKPFVHALIVSEDVIALNKKLNTPLKTSLPTTYKLSSAISPIVSLSIADSPVAYNGNNVEYIIPVNTSNIVHDLTQQSFSYIVQSRVYYCANFEDDASTLMVVSNCTYTPINSSFVKCKCNHLTNVFVMETTTVTYVSYIIIICVAGGILLVCCVFTITFICVGVCCCYYKKKYQVENVVVKKKVVYVGKRMKDGTIMLVAKAVDTDIEMLEGGKKKTTTTTTTASESAIASNSQYTSENFLEGVTRQTTSAHAYKKEGTYVSSEEMKASKGQSITTTETKDGHAVVNYEHMRNQGDFRETGSYRTLTSRSNSEEERKESSRGSIFKGYKSEHNSSYGSRQGVQYAHEQHGVSRYGYQEVDEVHQESTTLDDYHNEEYNEYSNNVANAHYYTKNSGSRNQSSKSSRTESPFSSKGSIEKHEMVAVRSQNSANGYSKSFATYETSRTVTDENGTRTEIVKGVNDNGKVNVEKMYSQNGHTEMITGNGYEVKPQSYNEKRVSSKNNTISVGDYSSMEQHGDTRLKTGHSTSYSTYESSQTVSDENGTRTEIVKGVNDNGKVNVKKTYYENENPEHVRSEFIEPSFIVEEQEVSNCSKNTAIVEDEATASAIYTKQEADDYYSPPFLSELSEKESKCSSRRSLSSTRVSSAKSRHSRLASGTQRFETVEQEPQYVFEEKVYQNDPTIVAKESIVEHEQEEEHEEKIVRQRNQFTPKQQAIVRKEHSYVVEGPQHTVEDKIVEPEQPRFITKNVTSPKPVRYLPRETVVKPEPKYVEKSIVEEHIEEPQYVRKETPKYIVETEELVEDSVEDQLFATEDYDEEKIVKSKNIHSPKSVQEDKSHHASTNVLSIPEHFAEDRLKGAKTRSSSFSSLESSSRTGNLKEMYSSSENLERLKTGFTTTNSTYESTSSITDHNGTRTNIVKEVNNNGNVKVEKSSSFEERPHEEYQERIVKQGNRFIPKETATKQETTVEKNSSFEETAVEEEEEYQERIVKQGNRFIPKQQATKNETKVIEKVIEQEAVQISAEKDKVVKQKPRYVPRQEKEQVEKVVKPKPKFIPPKARSVTKIAGASTENQEENYVVEKKSKKPGNNQASSYSTYETKRTVSDENGSRTEVVKGVNNNGKVNVEKSTHVNGKRTNVEHSEDYDANYLEVKNHQKNPDQFKSSQHSIIKKETRRTITDDHGTRTEITIEINDNGKITTETKTVYHKGENKANKINFYERKSKNNLLQQDESQERVVRAANNNKVVIKAEPKVAKPSRSISAPETKKTKSESQIKKNSSPNTEDSRHVLQKVASNSKNEVKTKAKNERVKKNETRVQKVTRNSTENNMKVDVSNISSSSSETKAVVNKSSNDRNIDITKGANETAVRLEAKTVETEQVVNNKSSSKSNNNAAQNNYSSYTTYETSKTTVSDENGSRTEMVKAVNDNGKVNVEKTVMVNGQSLETSNYQQDEYHGKVVKNSYVSNLDQSEGRYAEVVNHSRQMNYQQSQPVVPVVPKPMFTQPVNPQPVFVSQPQPVLHQPVVPVIPKPIISQQVQEPRIVNQATYITEEYIDNREAYRMQDQSYMQESRMVNNAQSYSNQNDASYVTASDKTKQTNEIVYYNEKLIVPERNNVTGYSNLNLRVENVNAMNENRLKNSSSEIDHTNYGKTSGTYETTYKSYYKNDGTQEVPPQNQGPVWRIDGDYVGMSKKATSNVVVENRQRNEFSQSTFDPPRNTIDPPRAVETNKPIVDNSKTKIVTNTYVSRNEVAENRLRNESSEINHTNYGKNSTVGIYETTYKSYFNDGSQEPIVRPDLPNTINIGQNNAKITTTSNVQNSAFQSSSTQQQANAYGANLRVNNSTVETRNNSFVDTRTNNSYFESRNNYASNTFGGDNALPYNNYPPTIEPANNRSYVGGERKPKPERFPVGQLPKEPYMNNGQISDDPMLHQANIVQHKDGGYYIKVQIKPDPIDTNKKSVFVVPTDNESKRRVNPIPLQMVDIYSINENQAQQVILNSEPQQ